MCVAYKIERLFNDWDAHLNNFKQTFHINEGHTEIFLQRRRIKQAIRICGVLSANRNKTTLKKKQ